MKFPSVNLEEILQVCDSGEWGDDPKGGESIPVIRVADVKPGNRISYETAPLRSISAKKRAEKTVKSGDILVVKSSGSSTSVISGRVAQVSQVEDGEYGFANFLLRLRVDERQYSSRFLIYVLSSPPVRAQVLSIVGATTYPNLSVPAYKRITIPNPPLVEQERIAKLLDEADELRKLRAQTDRRAAELIPALFHEMFGDPATNPNGWPLKMLGRITTIDAPMVDPRHEEFLDLPHVGPERIEGETGKILPTKTAREDALVSGKFLFDDRHVLYSKIRPYLRKVALPDFRGLCSADVYPVTPAKNEICREYLSAVLLSEAFTKYTSGHYERANIPKINREQFNAYWCPVPHLPLQHKFAQRVTEIRAMEASQTASRKRLEELFQSMLHRAFEGEL